MFLLSKQMAGIQPPEQAARADCQLISRSTLGSELDCTAKRKRNPKVSGLSLYILLEEQG